MTYQEAFRAKIVQQQGQKEFVGNPSPISGFWIFVIGAAVGAFFAPILLSASRAGQRYLASLVEEKLRRQ